MHHLPSRYIPCDGRLTSSAYFNPHSPQEERPGGAVFVCTRFQSTLPAWGATIPIASKIWPLVISIHAPRMESDFVVYDCQTGFTKFQSTLPAWGATHHSISRFIYNDFNPRSPQGERRPFILIGSPMSFISIHAPRMGSDCRHYHSLRHYTNFNPRSPHGERHNHHFLP